MPMYDYECRACGHRYEELRRMAERAEARPCPRCASVETALALSAPAVLSGGATNYGSSGNCFSGG